MPFADRGRAAAKDRSWVGRLLDDLTLRLSAVFLLVVILMPPEGLGVDLCPSRLFTRAPCPGCGMTRSGSNLVRGHFVRAVEYHPFGPVLIPVIAAFGLLGLAPRRWRQAARDFVTRHERFLRPFYGVGVAALIIFGIVRWACVYFGWMSFPARWP
jgi:hypothetical protein